MLYRIEAGLFPHLDDTIGRKTAASIREASASPSSPCARSKCSRWRGSTRNR